jgi:hypothetical protein
MDKCNQKEMSRIKLYEDFETNEASNMENLKLVLSSLKDASEEEITKVSQLLYSKLTWGNIKDIADVVHVQIEKS